MPMRDAEVAALTLHVGNRTRSLGELFEIERRTDDDDLLSIAPADDRLDFIGSGMEGGRLQVSGSAGHYAGHQLRGGELRIDGDCGDYLGGAMLAGRIQVGGNAGDAVGAPSGGLRLGQQGGEIVVHGSVGARAGERQRRGILYVGGDAGELLGHRMVAGTLFVAGRVGAHPGYGMNRGSLILRERPAQLAATFVANGRQPLGMLELLLRELDRVSGKAVARPADGATLLRARMRFACIELSSGRPRRMPREFLEGYGPAVLDIA